MLARVGERILRRLEVVVGGPARFQVIAVLGCVLALDSADKGTIGAVGEEIEQSLGITNTELGALITVSSGMGALGVLPMGVLADRVNRVRILAVSIAVWSVGMLISGAADSYMWLLVSRMALGAVTAAAGPVVASLTGDFFPPAERGRIYGFILSGELLGAGFGLVVGGDLASLLSWRFAFWFLALLGMALVVVIVRKLPEPARGGQSRLLPGADTPLPGPGRRGGGPPGRGDGGGPPSRDDVVRAAVRGRGVTPDRALLPRRNPARMSMWEAARYILRIPTNVVLIVASSIGYFFFAGLRTFAVIFVSRQYGIGQAAISGLIPLLGAGALLGVLTGGRSADWLTRHGHVSARVTVPAVAYLAAAVFFVPPLLTTSVLFALPFFVISAAALSAANPPLDAARLDVVHFRLWGRAESVRTFLRMGGEAVAPVTFGFLADILGSGEPGGARGLQYTFLITLVPLAANAVILLHGRRTYPRDVATAAAFERLTERGRGRPGR
ncbi:MFS transporter [Streptosporangium sp. NPDC051022]|uniref:MFS transporter n=1 Tax=Streptosporangium sp. NPDC051022 TaxID=3155752 RepID=UPI0034305E95